MTIFICEPGVDIPKSLETGAHPLLTNISSIETLRVSVAERSHPVDYSDADVFIRISPEKFSPIPVDFHWLMSQAFQIRDKQGSRVGAAILTYEGQYFAAVEKATTKHWTDLPGLAAALSDISSFERRQIVEGLIDVSTSVHAETVALLNAIGEGLRPRLIAVTRMPCLACCRLIRQVGAEAVAYHHYRGFHSLPASIVALSQSALGATKLELFQGYRYGERIGD